MAEHRIQVRWQRQGEFSHQGFERQHRIHFQPHLELPVAGAGNDIGADPEQLLAAAMSSCFMQTFLALAAKKRLVVESYEDDAEARLSQRDDGRFWVSEICLRPKVIFASEPPKAEVLAAMYDKSHQHCFIANSTHSTVVIEPR